MACRQTCSITLRRQHLFPFLPLRMRELKKNPKQSGDDSITNVSILTQNKNNKYVFFKIFFIVIIKKKYIVGIDQT